MLGHGFHKSWLYLFVCLVVTNRLSRLPLCYLVIHIAYFWMGFPELTSWVTIQSNQIINPFNFKSTLEMSVPFKLLLVDDSLNVFFFFYTFLAFANFSH
jgi:hypothetical protein